MVTRSVVTASKVVSCKFSPLSAPLKKSCSWTRSRVASHCWLGQLEDGSWGQGQKTPSKQVGPWPRHGLAHTRRRFLPPCLHRDATGAVHSQSWKLQQPVSRHYNNLHTSGYETEHSEKVLYWSLKSQRCGRVWGEFLSFSVAPGLPLVRRHSVLPWGGASPLRAAW